jgi:hypothetical protein
MSINTWGPITWFLFHTLAEKIKDEYFHEEKDNILELVRSICCILPCPDCANHAKHTLQQVNFIKIQSKENFKHFFLEFHNLVNIRNNNPVFTYDQLNNKYKHAQLNNIIKQFLFIFNKPSGNINIVLTNTMMKKKVLSDFIGWYNKAHYKFNI